MLRATGASIRGPAHVDSGQTNQDAIGLRGSQGGWICSVADGLGSRPLSHIGSQAACLATRRVIRRSMDWAEPKLLIGDIYRKWLSSLPINPSKVATTLLVAACKNNGETLVAQLGDGLVIYVSEGCFGVLTPERNGFANQTNALGISNAWSDWRYAHLQLTKSGDGVLLMTDGISDDIDSEKLEAFFRKVHKECVHRSRRCAKNWLKTQLEMWPTPSHSDDKTLAMIFVD